MYLSYGSQNLVVVSQTTTLLESRLCLAMLFSSFIFKKVSLGACEENKGNGLMFFYVEEKVLHATFKSQ